MAECSENTWNTASGRGRWGSRAKSERWQCFDVYADNRFRKKDLGGVAVRQKKKQKVIG